MTEEPSAANTRRRAGAELSLRGAQAVLRARGAHGEKNGRSASCHNGSCMTCSISDLSRSGESERAGGLAAQRPSDCRAERLLLVPLAQRLLVAGSRRFRGNVTRSLSMIFIVPGICREQAPN